MGHTEVTMDQVRHRLNVWCQNTTQMNDVLCICSNENTLNQKKKDGEIWSDLLFTDPVLVPRGQLFAHPNMVLHHIRETEEHRMKRYQHNQKKNKRRVRDTRSTSSVVDLTVDEPSHVITFIKRPSLVRPNVVMPLSDSKLLYMNTMVMIKERGIYTTSRSFVKLVTRLKQTDCSNGNELARLIARNKPPAGWVQFPDECKLVTDAGKLNALDTILQKLKEEGGHRVLIYCQMRAMVDLLEEYMYYRNYTCMRLDNTSRISEHREMIHNFLARPEVFAFLLCSRVGGMSINFTVADTVIFYDTNWNPVLDKQAIDRVYRLSQMKQMTVYRLISNGTFEEKILKRVPEDNEHPKTEGSSKPEALKPEEVASVLIDNEEIEPKDRQEMTEKQRDDLARERKLAELPSLSLPSCSSMANFQSLRYIPAPMRLSPNCPLLEDDDSCNCMLVDEQLRSSIYCPKVEEKKCDEFALKKLTELPPRSTMMSIPPPIGPLSANCPLLEDDDDDSNCCVLIDEQKPSPIHAQEVKQNKCKESAFEKLAQLPSLSSMISIPAPMPLSANCPLLEDDDINSGILMDDEMLSSMSSFVIPPGLIDPLVPAETLLPQEEPASQSVYSPDIETLVIENALSIAAGTAFSDFEDLLELDNIDLPLDMRRRRQKGRERPRTSPYVSRGPTRHTRGTQGISDIPSP